jgi:peptidoglycan hydrolase CwlO-like protein
MKKYLILLIVIILIGCGKEENTPEMPEDKIFEKVDASNEKFLRTQDSILRNYAAAIRLINQIDNELTKLSNVPQSIETQNLERDILQKIEYLSFQLKTKNDELNILERNIKSLAKENKEFRERIKTLETILAEKDRIIDNQKSRIEELEKELNLTIRERDIAIESKIEAEKRVEETTLQKNTAFYVIGTEQDLENKGIIKMEGEGFLGIGGKFVPNPDANINYFKKINISIDTLLQFPTSFTIQEIVSNHNKKHLEIIDSPAGDSFLRIKNPEEFWLKDKSLIIIVKRKK